MSKAYKKNKRNKQRPSSKRQAPSTKAASNTSSIKKEVWAEVEKAYHDHTSLKGRIIGCVEGGLSVDIKGVTAFLPKDHFGKGTERNLNRYCNQEIEAIVTKISRTSFTVVLSRALISGNNIIKPVRDNILVKAGKLSTERTPSKLQRRKRGRHRIHIKRCKLCPRYSNYVEEHEYESHVTVHHGGWICPVCGDAISKKDINHKYNHKNQGRRLPTATFVQGGSPGLSKKPTRRNPPRKPTE